VAQFPDLPIVFLNGRGLAKYQVPILKILGVQNEIRWLKNPTRVVRLLVPDVGYRINDLFEPFHAQFLGAYQDGISPSGICDKVWVSRSQLNSEKYGAIVGEVEIQHELEDAG
jgi:hypothetical protein